MKLIKQTTINHFIFFLLLIITHSFPLLNFLYNNNKLVLQNWLSVLKQMVKEKGIASGI